MIFAFDDHLAILIFFGVVIPGWSILFRQVRLSRLRR